MDLIFLFENDSRREDRRSIAEGRARGDFRNGKIKFMERLEIMATFDDVIHKINEVVDYCNENEKFMQAFKKAVREANERLSAINNAQGNKQ